MSWIAVVRLLKACPALLVPIVCIEGCHVWCRFLMCSRQSSDFYWQGSHKECPFGFQSSASYAGEDDCLLARAELGKPFKLQPLSMHQMSKYAGEGHIMVGKCSFKNKHLPMDLFCLFGLFGCSCSIPSPWPESVPGCMIPPFGFLLHPIGSLAGFPVHWTSHKPCSTSDNNIQTLTMN